jgi:hypothetical protein
MNQFGIKYIYKWKCHKETACMAILNKQKYHFVFLQKQRTGEWNGSCLGVGKRGKGGGCGESV